MTIGAAAAARWPKIDWSGEDKWQLVSLACADTREEKGRRAIFLPGSIFSAPRISREWKFGSKCMSDQSLASGD